MDPPEHLDFRRVSYPGEAHACYLYEFSLESSGVRSEVDAVRRRRVESAKKLEDWLRTNPYPGGFASALSYENPVAKVEWFKKFNAEIAVTTKLGADLHFLFDCRAFPSKNWLEMPLKERQKIADLFHPSRPLIISPTDPARLEATPMSIRPLRLSKK